MRQAILYMARGSMLRPGKWMARGVIVKTGRHRAQSITLIENAKTVIVKKLKYVYKDEDSLENNP
ncbi:MAG: hypothetical protein MUO26_04550 [Methanotrichaceae archaeon]|nr:hypothetical protein [Methanotrichaceae archaeon]